MPTEDRRDSRSPAPGTARQPAPRTGDAGSPGPATEAGLIAVDARSRAPLYHQIYLILRNKIRDGLYAEGSLLPSENELAEIYAVSRITSRRALDELVREGLARRERGRGTRVQAVANPIPAAENTVEGLIENVTLWGAKTTVDILDFGLTPAPDYVAAELSVDPGHSVQRCVRVRRLNGVPIGHVTSYVPADIGALFSQPELSETPLLALLQSKGIKAARADQVLTATLADPQIARLLSVDVGAPLLRKVRTVFDTVDRAVEFIDVLYRPDMYQFRLSLTRDEGRDGEQWSPAA